jgi:hypothetical protein
LIKGNEGKIDTDMAWYVFKYYGQLMNGRERMANRHLMRTFKAVEGRSDLAAQEEARGRVRHLREWLSDDPEVLQLARDGYEAFAVHTGKRILHEHRDQIVLNRCPQCGRLARTPKARQCRFCRHDWHGETADAG